MSHVPKGSKCECDSKDSTEIRAGIKFFKIPDLAFKFVQGRNWPFQLDSTSRNKKKKENEAFHLQMQICDVATSVTCCSINRPVTLASYHYNLVATTIW